MIGIQRPTDTIQSENDVLSNFDTLCMTDDFIEHNSLDAKFGYTIFEKMDYVVFREENSIDFFTTHVIKYIRTLKDTDTITVKENEDDSQFMFVGSATEFIEFWDSMGEEE
jgi:hypothetical protein|tara:strand:+ start:3543 stop:3875 length:333 start_codon:yes stop_codon:yes gene_type:complete